MKVDIGTCSSREWDVLTALRGPDASSDGAYLVKRVTTAVIRHAAGAKPLHVYLRSDPDYGFVSTPEQARSFWEGLEDTEKRAAREFWREGGHFKHHIHLAFRHLRTIDKKFGEYWDWLQDELQKMSDLGADDLRETHKFCGGCGAKMQVIVITTHYDRKTGQPIGLRYWRCPKWAGNSTHDSVPI